MRLGFSGLPYVLLLAALLCACNTPPKSASQPLPDTSDRSWAPIDYTTSDDQWFLGDNRRMAVTEKGYYFFVANHQLNFYDRVSGITVPVCAQPDCIHGPVPSCDAWFDPELYESGLGIWYQNGALFLVGRADADDQGSYLYQLSPDGSRRTQLGCLYPGEISGMILHRGYAYYRNENRVEADVCRLFRLALNKGGEREEICSYEGVLPNIYRLFGYEDCIYFQMGEYADRNYTQFFADIYRYSAKDGSIETIKQDVIKSYCIEKNHLYYSTGEKVMRYDLTTRKEIIFLDTGGAEYISFDGIYLYFDNSLAVSLTGAIDQRRIIVTDLDAQLIDTLSLGDLGSILGGDCRYLLRDRWTEPSAIVAFDKSRLGEEDQEWSVLLKFGA